MLSACRGVTDALLIAREPGRAAGRRARRPHRGTARSATSASPRTLLDGDLCDEFVVDLDQDCRDIAGILQTVRLVRSASTTMRDLISGYGEIWSTRLFERLLRRRGMPGSRAVDRCARALLVEWGPLGPGVRWEQSRDNLQTLVPPNFTGTLVITGFIATDTQGLQTTLGRNGSDYSASIFGALLDAGEIVIWTDVDGVLSADPRLVPEAHGHRRAVVQRGDGARVLRRQGHPSADDGARRAASASRSGSRTRSPRDKAGTLIHERSAPNPLVKGITTIDRIALVNLEGAGMIGVPGTAHRLFGALREEGISVILISQGSSEHSICFAVPEAEAERAERVVRRAFDPELREGQIQSIEVDRGCSILAVVGDGMAGAHGVAAQVFTALGTRRRQRARDRAGRVGAQHLGRHRRHRTARARCAPCTRASICRRTRSRSA